MAPNLTGSPTGLFLAETEVISGQKQQPQPQPQLLQKPQQAQKEHRYRWQIVWRNVIAFIYLHTSLLYAVYLIFTTLKGVTVLWGFFVGALAAFGVTAGAHRLWAHRSYKARWPLRMLLAVLQTIAFQNHIYEWVRDHRVHHKFTDTDADPHNSKRGFFFSHIGWLMVRKHRDVGLKGKVVDMSDLEKDWVVMLQKKTYPLIMPLFCFVIPTLVPVYCWGETGWNSWHTTIFRYTLSLNFTWLVNSAAHIWGTRPYDKTISSAENISVAILAFGEGWHNYHHAFPWDYKTSELGGYKTNLSTAFIDFFARIGWAYDLKTVPMSLVKMKAARKGDGSRHDKDHGDPRDHHRPGDDLWGWGDRDMTPEDKQMAHITFKKRD